MPNDDEDADESHNKRCVINNLLVKISWEGVEKIVGNVGNTFAPYAGGVGEGIIFSGNK